MILGLGIVDIIVIILMGALVGWVASLIMKSRKSFLGYVAVGILGSILGGFLAGILGIGGGIFVTFAIALGGTCLLIVIARALKIIK